MDKRGGAEAERPRKRPERDAAEFGKAIAQFGERGCESAEAGSLDGRHRHERQACLGEPRADAGRDGDGVRDDDVGGADREDEPQEVVVARAGRRGIEQAERADFPGVEGGVAERRAVAFEDEEPRVTAGRDVFDHGGRVSS